MRSEPQRVKVLADRPIALTIAGFDPSSGAGATADLQVFADHGVSGVIALTALTVQSTQQVLRVEPVSPSLLRETLACLTGDRPIAGVKIGMLATAQGVETVTDFLRSASIPRDRIVLDPVIRSTSGAVLLEPEGVRRVSGTLFKQVGWVTPNLEELGSLLGEPTPGRAAIPAMAARLAQLGAPGLNVIVTGGHLTPPDDFLRTADGQEQWFPGSRIAAASTHGTGCAFSSALLCRLLLGDDPAKAVAAAKAYVRARLERS